MAVVCFPFFWCLVLDSGRADAQMHAGEDWAGGTRFEKCRRVALAVGLRLDGVRLKARGESRQATSDAALRQAAT